MISLNPESSQQVYSRVLKQMDAHRKQEEKYRMFDNDPETKIK
jgi:hypothetical protein